MDRPVIVLTREVRRVEYFFGMNGWEEFPASRQNRQKEGLCGNLVFPLRAFVDYLKDRY